MNKTRFLEEYGSMFDNKEVFECLPDDIDLRLIKETGELEARLPYEIFHSMDSYIYGHLPAALRNSLSANIKKLEEILDSIPEFTVQRVITRIDSNVKEE